MPTKKERALFERGQVVSLDDIDQDAEEYMYSRYKHIPCLQSLSIRQRCLNPKPYFPKPVLCTLSNAAYQQVRVPQRAAKGPNRSTV